MKGGWGTHCPHCKQIYPEGYVEKAKALSTERKIKSIEDRRKRGDRIGRPRQIEYEVIRRLRDHGFSIQRIANELKVSRGTVNHALRVIA